MTKNNKSKIRAFLGPRSSTIGYKRTAVGSCCNCSPHQQNRTEQRLFSLLLLSPPVQTLLLLCAASNTQSHCLWRRTPRRRPSSDRTRLARNCKDVCVLQGVLDGHATVADTWPPPKGRTRLLCVSHLAIKSAPADVLSLSPSLFLARSPSLITVALVTLWKPALLTQPARPCCDADSHPSAPDLPRDH